MKRAVIPTVITEFRGPFGFLSNMYAPAPVRLNFAPTLLDGDDHVYPTVEHGWHAWKVLKLNERKKLWLPGLDAMQAKFIGNSFKARGIIRPDFFENRLFVIEQLLLQKFTPTLMRRKLFSTMGATLIEGNWWHDIFFGVCNGKCKCGPHEPEGENHLGQLLMRVRTHLATAAV